MLKIENISKIYKSGKHQVKALDNINFELNKGDHLAVIGPNGSGKTTLVKIITQLSSPTEGKVFLGGRVINQKDKSSFGLMLGQSMLYHRLSVRHNLEYYGSLYNVPQIQERINQILENLKIAGRAEDLIEDLSYGLISKVAFARAMIHSPEILVLDEPTNGLDPISSEDLYLDIKKRETVILLTHNLSEAVKFSNKILFLNAGKQLYFGTIDQFCAYYKIKQTPVEITRKLKELYVAK